MRRGNAKQRHRPKHGLKKCASSMHSWARDPRNILHSKLVAAVVSNLTVVEEEEDDVIYGDDDFQLDGSSDRDADTEVEHGDLGEGGADAEGIRNSILNSPQGKESLRHMRMECAVILQEWSSRGKVFNYYYFCIYIYI
jgi:hypothetical protein